MKSSASQSSWGQVRFYSIRIDEILGVLNTFVDIRNLEDSQSLFSLGSNFYGQCL